MTPLGAQGRARDNSSPEWFWGRVEQGGIEACWPWRGHTNQGGYGVFESGNSRYGNRRVHLAHRRAFELAFGPIPEHLPNICHRCDNPPCCNPHHLFAATQLENIADMKEKGRAAAEQFGVHQVTVSKIVRRKLWGHVA